MKESKRSARPALLAAALAPLSACSSSPALQGEGGACFQVTDCALGLVCVPQPGSAADGPRHCSSDTSALVNTEGAAVSDAGSPAGPDGEAVISDSSDEGAEVASGD